MVLVDILSHDRFATYLKWAGHDGALAERLYNYNVQLSAAFYSSLHMLEIALRNKTDAALIAYYGNDWLNNANVLIEDYQQRCVRDARENLLNENKLASHNQIIAALNFGFWSSLFGKKSNHLWSKLRTIFRVKGLQRATIAHKLRNLRRLRNRIAHYKPILGLPLAEFQQDILNLTAWMSVDAAAWITTHSNIVYPATPIIILNDAGEPFFDKALIKHLPL